MNYKLLVSMQNIIWITNDLSQALLRNDQDIVNVMNLANFCKGKLESIGESGWDSLL